MSKLSFRARNIDYSKRMPIFIAENLPDISEYAAINRSVPQMPSGMEKEEENEYHLQQAITARQVSAVGAAKPCPLEAVIPIPKVEIDVAGYSSLYGDSYKPPKQLIRVQAALSLEPEYPEYDLDEEDERWLNCICDQLKLDITPIEFERIMDTLEKQSEYKVISAEDAKLLLQADDDIVFAVYDYWLNKRFNYTSQGRKLIPRVRAERRDATAPVVADPYVGFRRRAEKMQTRKNRKNDEESYEKILKLRNDLQKALTLLEMVKRREKSKRELIKLGFELAQKRLDMKDYDSEVYNQLRQDVKPMFQFSKEEMLIGRSRRQSSKRRKLKEDKDLVSREYLLENAEQWYKPALFPSTSLSSPSYTYSHLSPLNSRLSCYADLADKHLPGSKDRSFNEPTDGPYALKRRRGCIYLAPTSSDSFNPSTGQRCWPWEERKPQFRYANCYLNSSLPPDEDSQDRMALCISPSLRYVGLCRRRMGRGGRVLIDRVSSLKELRLLETANVGHHYDEAVDQPSTSKNEIVHKHYPKANSNALLSSKIALYHPSPMEQLESDSIDEQSIYDTDFSSLLSNTCDHSIPQGSNFLDPNLVSLTDGDELTTKHERLAMPLPKTLVTVTKSGGQNRRLPLNLGVTAESYSLNADALVYNDDSAANDRNNCKVSSLKRRRLMTGIEKNDEEKEKGDEKATVDDAFEDAEDSEQIRTTPLDSRQAFEATAAVMTSSQMLQLTERYERPARPPTPAVDDNDSPSLPMPPHCTHYGNNYNLSLRRENGFLSC